MRQNIRKYLLEQGDDFIFFSTCLEKDEKNLEFADQNELESWLLTDCEGNVCNVLQVGRLGNGRRQRLSQANVKNLKAWEKIELDFLFAMKCWYLWVLLRTRFGYFGNLKQMFRLLSVFLISDWTLFHLCRQIWSKAFQSIPLFY